MHFNFNNLYTFLQLVFAIMYITLVYCILQQTIYKYLNVKLVVLIKTARILLKTPSRLIKERMFLVL